MIWCPLFIIDLQICIHLLYRRQSKYVVFVIREGWEFFCIVVKDVNILSELYKTFLIRYLINIFATILTLLIKMCSISFLVVLWNEKVIINFLTFWSNLFLWNELSQYCSTARSNVNVSIIQNLVPFFVHFFIFFFICCSIFLSIENLVWRTYKLINNMKYYIENNVLI